jgi:hypothetical protein
MLRFDFFGQSDTIALSIAQQYPIMSIFSNLFGNSNQKYLEKIQPLVEEINGLEKEFENFSGDQLKNKDNGGITVSGTLL